MLPPPKKNKENKDKINFYQKSIKIYVTIYFSLNNNVLKITTFFMQKNIY